MIFITGDIHGDPSRLSVDNFPQQKDMTKDDYVIILGDFGLVWNKDEESGQEKWWLNWLESKPFTTLFIDGNHENYDRLDAYPIEDWNGGKVQYIRPSVIHLMRGYVFNIDGAKIFAMGGAASHDIRDGILEVGDPRIKAWNHDLTKLFRINHLSWWERELPNQEELIRGRKSLAAANWEVDFILSHEAPLVAGLSLGYPSYEMHPLVKYLQKVDDKTKFTYHYCGHYHIDRDFIGCKVGIRYMKIERIW